jgi:hypothetical protein
LISFVAKVVSHLYLSDFGVDISQNLRLFAHLALDFAVPRFS